MKRIIKGVTYNTDTGTKLAECSDTYFPTVIGDEEGYYEKTVTCVLYQTRGGAYFKTESMKMFKDPNEDSEKEVMTSFIMYPASTDDAHDFIVNNLSEVEVFNNPFGDPPEAEGDHRPQTEATIYARVPASLKARIEEASDMNNLSMNSYVIRCLEKCLGLASSPQPVYRPF